MTEVELHGKFVNKTNHIGYSQVRKTESKSVKLT